MVQEPDYPLSTGSTDDTGADSRKNQGSNPTWKVFVSLESFCTPGKFLYPRKVFFWMKLVRCREWSLADWGQTVHKFWKLSRSSENSPGHLETLQTIWKICRSSGNFPGYLKTFQATSYSIFRNFPGHLETIQAIRKLSRPPQFFQISLLLCVNFAVYFDIFQAPISMLPWVNMKHFT